MSVNQVLLSNTVKVPQNVEFKNVKVDGAISSEMSEFIVGPPTLGVYKYTTIQQGINAAYAAFLASGSTNRQIVYVTPGVYTENINLLDGGYDLVGTQAMFDFTVVSGVPTNGVVNLAGTITCNINHPVGISLITIKVPASGPTGGGPCISSPSTPSTTLSTGLTISNCNILSMASSYIINNNPNILVVCDTVIFTDSPQGIPGVNSFAISTNNALIVLKACVIGMGQGSGPIESAAVRADGSLVIIIQAVNSGSSVSVRNGGQAIVFNSSFTLQDVPTFNIEDAASTIIAMNNSCISQSSAPGPGLEWASNNPSNLGGNLLSGGNVLLGRNTIAGSLTATALTVL